MQAKSNDQEKIMQAELMELLFQPGEQSERVFKLTLLLVKMTRLSLYPAGGTVEKVSLEAWDDLAAAMKEARNITSIEMGMYHIPTVVAYCLKSILESCSALTDVNLRLMYTSDESLDVILQGVKNNKFITSLYSPNKMGKNSALRLQEILMENKNLTKLSLETQSLDREVNRHIPSIIRSIRFLENLHLEGCDCGAGRYPLIEDDVAHALAEYLKSNNIVTRLCLRAFDLGTVAGDLFRALLANKTLRTFDIISTNIDDVTIEPLCEALVANRTLAELEVGTARFSKAAFKKLEIAMKSNRRITYLRAWNMGEVLLHSIQEDCARNKANIAIGLAVLDYFLMTATRLPSDVRRLIVAYSCPFFNQHYANKLDDYVSAKFAVKPLFLYFNGLYNRIGSISDDHEKGVAFYEFKRQMLAKLDMPGAWRQQFQDLEYSGYMDFYNQLRATFGYGPVAAPVESSCVLM